MGLRPLRRFAEPPFAAAKPKGVPPFGIPKRTIEHIKQACAEFGVRVLRTDWRRMETFN
jgi:hypothetical protein